MWLLLKLQRRKKINWRIVHDSSLVADTFKIEIYFQPDSKQLGADNRNPHNENPQNGNPHMT